MKLNFASGLHPTELPGWVNVDLRWHGVTGPHVYADGFALPFQAASFDAAYLGHVLEHIDFGSLPALGVELRRVLRTCAVVMTVGPDIDKAVATNQPASVLSSIADLYGGPGGHKWVATEDLTVRACEMLGLTRIAAVDVAEVEPPEWPNPTCAPWQCAVVGVTP